MLKFLRRCFKIAICHLKIIFDVFLVCICFCCSTGFPFSPPKVKITYISQNSWVLYLSLRIFQGVLKSWTFKNIFALLQKLFHKNSNLEIHLHILVFNFKAAFLSHGSVEADLVVLIPGVAINIADSRAVLPSGLALLNNLSLETRQLKNVGAHISVICSGDPPADQLLV